MFEMLGISKRTAAALAATVVLLPLLVFVGPSPSAAHDQQVQRCSYDPFAGQQCWYEPVSHVHPPNHYSPPPDTSPPTTAAPPPTTAAPPPTTAAPPPNHYSPPPDTSPRPTTTTTTTTTTEPDDDGHRCDAHPPAAGCRQRGEGGSDDDDGDEEITCGHPTQHRHNGRPCHPFDQEHDGGRPNPLTAVVTIIGQVFTNLNQGAMVLVDEKVDAYQQDLDDYRSAWQGLTDSEKTGAIRVFCFGLGAVIGPYCEYLFNHLERLGWIGGTPPTTTPGNPSPPTVPQSSPTPTTAPPVTSPSASTPTTSAPPPTTAPPQSPSTTAAPPITTTSTTPVTQPPITTLPVPTTTTYCSEWRSFAEWGLPNHGEVVLYVNGQSRVSYQGSAERAMEMCQEALAELDD